MAEPLTTAAIGSVIVSALKEVGKLAWGFAKKTWQTFLENKWVIMVAGTSSGIFLYYYNMLYSWFAFPTILNIGVLGIFALTNIAWVISNWKSVPSDNKSDSSGPKVNIN